MKLFLSIFTFLSINAVAQFFTPAAEFLIGSNYYKSTHHQNDQIEYEGVSLYYGLKGKLLIGNHFAVNAAGGIKYYPFDADYFISSTVQATIYRNYNTGFSVFCEAGAEVSDWGDLSLPLFAGVNQYVGDGFSFNFRLRIPTIIDVNYFNIAGHYEAGMEASLQFELSRNNKPITRSGNPFILD